MSATFLIKPELEKNHNFTNLKKYLSLFILGPKGCLQYFSESSGCFRNFGMPSGTATLTASAGNDSPEVINGESPRLIV